MTAVVRVEQSPGSPLAVVRRQARQSELSRVVPECCGLVWNVVRVSPEKQLAKSLPGAHRATKPLAGQA